MKKRILLCSLWLIIFGLSAQNEGAKIITASQGVQQNNYTIQVGLPYLGENIQNTERATKPIDLRFPWDIRYLYKTFAEESFDVSKGYFSDKILINWTIRNNIGSTGNLLLYRREYKEVDVQNWGGSIADVTSTTMYEDKYIEGGVLYEYKIVADGIPGDQRYNNFITGIGYRSPTAIVTGNVNFKGGNPVKDVTVRVNSSGAVPNRGSALHISANAHVEIRALNKAITKATSVQAWMRPAKPYTSDDEAAIRFFQIESPFDTIDATVKLSAASQKLVVTVGESVYEVHNSYPSGKLDSRGDDILVPVTEFNVNFVHFSVVIEDGMVPLLYLNGRQITKAYQSSAELNYPSFSVSIPSETNTLTAHGLRDWDNVYLGGGNAVYLDEIRIWNTVKSDEKIRTDYRRYIGGNDPSLVAYFRANENVGAFAYDLSRAGFNYNKNHGKLWDENTPVNDKVKWVSGVDDTPSSDQLGVLGVTDQNGNYEITAIPYSGSGESFTITPLLGVHQFEPAQQLVFLGQGSEIVNKIEFIDKSSFVFKGRVLADTRGVFQSYVEVNGNTLVGLTDGDEYVSGPGILDEGYNYYEKNGEKYSKGEYWLNNGGTPDDGDATNGNETDDDYLERYARIATKGVNIYVDGDIVLDENNTPVTSDADGYFEVSVPIGKHSISVKKQGYSFAYNGRFPAENATFKEFFEDAEEVVNFMDETKVTLVGRVVGGTLEAEKPIGFGDQGIYEHMDGDKVVDTISSKNNIGRATIALDYLADGTNASPFTKFSFITNSESGEYRVELMPLNYKISQLNGLKILSNSSIQLLDADETVNLNATAPLTTPSYEKNDGSLVEGEPYHFEKSFTYRSTPVLEVVEQASDTSMFVNEIDYSTKGFKYPIYTQAIGDLPVYTIELHRYETYTNFDANDTVLTKVAINDGEFIINNNLARGGSNSEEIVPQENGIVLYNFKAGTPSISKPFTKTIDIKLRLGGVDYDALNLHKEAVIIGGANDGTARFVTEAPDVPDIILRDPPGSNSYASIEKGESYTFTSERDFTDAGGFGLSAELFFGAKFEVNGGFLTTESESINNVEGGFSVESSSKNGKSLTKTYTFNQTISTSDDPEYVGSDGDLYIGKGTNVSYGTFDMVRASNEEPEVESVSDTLKLINDNGQTVYLNKQKGLAFNEQSTGTFFIYSQKHILETLLPDLEAIVANAATSNADKKKYQQQIQIWRRFILNNERKKYIALNEIESTLKEETGNAIDTFILKVQKEIDASNNNVVAGIGPVGYAALQEKLDYANTLKNIHAENFKENISFDAGLGEFTKSHDVQNVSSESTSYNIEFEETLRAQLGFKLGGLGLVVKTNGFVKQDRNASVTTEEMSNTTITYTLKDNDPGNFLSVDVVNLFDGNGPIFTTLGGSTSCPYEGEEKSVFYNDSLHKVFLDSIKPWEEEIKTMEKNINIRKDSIGVYEKKIEGYKKSPLGEFAYFGEIAFCKREIKRYEDEIKEILIIIKDLRSKIIEVDKNFTKNIKVNTCSEVNCESEVLSNATQKAENPKISVEVANVSNVPEGRKAEFTLKLENLSDVNSDAAILNYFNLIVYNDSNPHNAILNIHPNGTQVYVPYGETVYYTMTLGKSVSDVYDYENLRVVLESNCDPIYVYDEVFVSAHFIPSCSEVIIDKPLENWVYNADFGYNSDGSTNPLKIDLLGYDQSFNSFKKIDLEYRLSTSPTWTRLHTYYNTQAQYDAAVLANETSISLIESPTLSFPFDIAERNFPDGNYEIRARSTCSNNTDFISEPISGKVDLNAPQRFGTPLPTDGILSAGEDLRVSFNENVFYNSAVSSVEIKGETNQLPINHNVSLYFEGNANTVLIEKPSIASDDITVEFWMNNRTIQSNAVILEQAGGLSIGLKQGEIYFTLGGDTAKGLIAIDQLFHHYTFTHQNSTGKIYIYEDDAELEFIKLGENGAFANNNDLVIGGNSFIGNLHDLRIWRKTIGLSDAYANMYAKLTGNEKDLIGYWPMTEGRGDLARDLARFKHAKVNASWDIKPKGSSYEFLGGQYLTLDNASFVQITAEMDATISFWMKTNVSQNASLFSNGRGDSSDIVQSNAYANKWAVNLSTDGLLSFESEGTSYPLTSQSINDDAWHHVALLLNRQGSLRTYLDAKQVSSNQMTNIGGFSGSKVWLGARGHTDFAANETVDNAFTGKMDEFRLWNTLRNVEQISRDRFNEVDNESIGLLLYAKMNAPDPSTGTGPQYYHAYSNQTTIPGNAVLSGGTVNYSNDVPAIKPARELIKFQVSHVINEDDMILEPVINDWAALEGQILDVTVHRMFDAANNMQESPITWTAFVNKNEVRWFAEGYNEVVDIVKNGNEERSFEITIINKGGVNQPFAISGIPNWLSLSTASGTISPDSKVVITARIDENLSAGEYLENLYLETDFGYNEKLQIKLRALTKAPEWALNPNDFDYSMNIIGKVKIDGVFSDDMYDKVAAFHNGELRGVTNIVYNEAYQEYFVFLTIYSNNASDEDITFSIWDATQGRIIQSTVNTSLMVPFIDNNVLGSLSQSALFENTDNVEQEIALNKGWTWVSLNVSDPNYANLDVLMADQILETSDRILSHSPSQLESYYKDDFIPVNRLWTGTISANGGLSTDYMYKMSFANKQKLIVKGTQVNVSTWSFPVKQNWNWLPYPMSENIPLNEAMALFDPSDGDLIKSQKRFAIYDPLNGWSGTLNSLEEGQGYMLKSSKNQVFKYPNVFGQRSNAKVASMGMSSQSAQGEMDEQFAKYADNMNAVVLLPDGYNNLFVYDSQGVLKGKAEKQMLGKKSLSFITIYGEASEVLTFHIGNGISQKASSKSIVFKGNQVLGSVVHPVLLEDALWEGLEIYPNPFRNDLSIQMHSKEATSMVVKLYNVLGQMVYIKTSPLIVGQNLVRISPKVSKGAYFMHLEMGDAKLTYKIIKN